MMPIKLLQFILLNCLSKPSVKLATKTCNLLAALLQNDLKSDNARNTTPTSMSYVSVIMLRTSSPLRSHLTQCTMIKEKSDQLGSVQKNNMYMQIQSVALVLEFEDNERGCKKCHL